jgi:RNA polymerase sigma factor (sigma-70 family)
MLVMVETTSSEMTYAEFVALRARITKDGYRSLSQDEHFDLIERVKRGERRAAELLVMLYDKFVFRVLFKDKVRKSSFMNVDLDESMQEGRLAVLKATKKYDPLRGSFATYLFWWLRSKSRIQRNSGDPLIRIKTPRKATTSETDFATNFVGLDDLINDEDGYTFGETIGADEPDPESAFMERQSDAVSMAAVRDAMKALSKRERTVLGMRFVENAKTLEEVGHVLGLTREGARLIEIKALAKIRRHLQLANFISD